MKSPSVIELLIQLMACRTLQALQTEILTVIRARTGAQAVAVYLQDITGRKLVSFACDGGMPLSRLPELMTELGEQRYGELDALQVEPFVYREASSPTHDKGLAETLFGRHGAVAAHRISLDKIGCVDLPNQVYVFLLVSSQNTQCMQEDHQVLHALWRSFYSLRPLLLSLEEHQQTEKRAVASSVVHQDQVDAMLSESLVGRSAQIAKMREQVAQYAQSKYAVLVQGETGTGKELVASSLHRLSPFSGGPFIVENISALPQNLIESELFGYKKGAFTGADTNRDGLIKRASGGTLFLDEIGDLSIDIQVKLLRVLQEKSVRPLGAEKGEIVDFRIVCATHVDIRKAIEQGRFRADLFYRISQLAITVPPLRERKGDSVYLAQFFLQEIAVNNSDSVKILSAGALSLLETAEFKGNVRELRNCMIKAAFLAERTSEISEDVISQAMQLKAGIDVSFQSEGENHKSKHVEGENDVHFLSEHGLRMSVINYEQRLLLDTYSRFDGDRGRMADFLKIPRRTLANKFNNFNYQTMEFEHGK